MAKRMEAATCDLKEKSGSWKLNDEALDRTVYRTRSARGYGHVRLTVEW